MARLLQAEDGRLTGPVEVPEWVRSLYGDYRAMMLDPEPPYPCHFGVIAERLGHMRYTFLEQSELEDPAPLADALAEYQQGYLSIPGRTAILGFVDCDRLVEEPERDYERIFWRILQGLHEADPSPWPDPMPIDPENPYWEFCFAGEPLIINGHAPIFKRRRSRLTTAGIWLVMQTRRNLDTVVGSPTTSEAVRKKIRAAIEEYDEIGVSPALGTLGEPGIRSWKEYWIPDNMEVRMDECPLVLSRHMERGQALTPGPSPKMGEGR